MLRVHSLFSGIQRLSFDYSRVIRIPWRELPATWSGYQRLANRRRDYRRLATGIDRSVIIALVAAAVAFFFNGEWHINGIHLTSMHMVLPLLLLSIVLLVRKSQLYIMQLDDHQIALTYSFIGVHFQILVSNLLWGLVIFYASSHIEVSSMEIGLLAAACTFVAIVMMSFLFYYYGIISPLKQWIRNRISLSSTELELTYQQIDRLINLLLLEHRKEDARHFLVLVFDSLKMDKKRAAVIIDEVLDEQTPIADLRLMKLASRAAATVMACISVFDVLKRSGLLDALR
jgi:hypothetical protein